jgi:putative Mn2+ efflux pump MntP
MVLAFCILGFLFGYFVSKIAHWLGLPLWVIIPAAVIMAFLAGWHVERKRP